MVVGNRDMKIIQIVENLDKGAVENWLVNIFVESRKTRPEWKWTFYCILGNPGRLDDIVKEAGGEIIYAPVTISNKWVFLRHLRQTLKTGKYNLVHAHHDFLSGFYMLASLGLPGRKIIQVHNNDEGIPVGNNTLRKILLPVFRKMAFAFSHDIVGISKYTLDFFRNGFKGSKPRFSVLYYGINMERFKKPVNREAFLQSSGIPTGSKVMLYAGRMCHDKNPLFVVDILQKILSLREDVYAVFVGKGELEQAVVDRAKELGVEDRIRMIGWSDDIPGIMKSCDAFVFPRLESPKEGLGLVVVESQCAGLPIFLTRGIVKDAIILEQMAFFVELEAPENWAQQIKNTLDKEVPLSHKESFEKMLQSRFELTVATHNLVKFYEKAGEGISA
jgi:glycosyltransferase involved in cell wall biosynthesis